MGRRAAHRLARLDRAVPLGDPLRQPRRGHAGDDLDHVRAVRDASPGGRRDPQVGGVRLAGGDPRRPVLEHLAEARLPARTAAGVPSARPGIDLQLPERPQRLRRRLLHDALGAAGPVRPRVAPLGARGGRGALPLLRRPDRREPGLAGRPLPDRRVRGADPRGGMGPDRLGRSLRLAALAESLDGARLTSPAPGDYGGGPARREVRDPGDLRHRSVPPTLNPRKRWPPWHATRWCWLTAAGSTRRSPSSGSTRRTAST